MFKFRKHAVYYLNNNKKWKKLATVKTTTYTHDNLENAKTYTYRVRCLDSDGNFISGVQSGKSNVFIAPMKITKVSRVSTGNQIKWKAVNGVYAYRLYRKSFGGSWKKLGDVVSGTSYIDTTSGK